MPDLQSELAKVNEAISSWEAPEPPQPAPKSGYFKPTNNVTRATFEYVRDNPGLTRLRIMDVLDAKGYKRTSTSSLLVQMCKQGMLKDQNGALFALQKEYSPLKSGKTFARAVAKAAPKAAKVAKPKKPKTPVEATPGVEAMLKSVQVVETPALSIESILRSLSVLEARRLYDELKTLFG